MNKKTTYFILPIAVLFFLIFLFSLMLFSSGPLNKKTSFVVSSGVAFSRLSQQLLEESIISNDTVFKLAGFLFMYHRNIKSGEYLFYPAMSQWDILQMMVNGEMHYRKITIPEGLTISEAVTIILNSQGLQGELTDYPKEGYILPDTYFYSWGDNVRDVLAKMSFTFAERTQPMWLNRDNNLPIEDLNSALTLASIIEKETSYLEEKARIAGVFYNRLKSNMRLQSDPTVIYSIFLKTCLLYTSPSPRD